MDKLDNFESLSHDIPQKRWKESEKHLKTNKGKVLDIQEFLKLFVYEKRNLLKAQKIQTFIVQEIKQY